MALPMTVACRFSFPFTAAGQGRIFTSLPWHPATNNHFYPVRMPRVSIPVRKAKDILTGFTSYCLIYHLLYFLPQTFTDPLKTKEVINNKGKLLICHSAPEHSEGEES